MVLPVSPTVSPTVIQVSTLDELNGAIAFVDGQTSGSYEIKLTADIYEGTSQIVRNGGGTLVYPGGLKNADGTTTALSNGQPVAARNDLYALSPAPGVTLTIEATNGAGGAYALDGRNSTVAANGTVTTGTTATYRGLFVYSGNVTIDDLTIQNAVARGGNGGDSAGGGAGLGGGLFIGSNVAGNAGAVTLDNVTFLNDSAVGGNGGADIDRGYSAGGGGGLGGNGSSQFYGSGGGGGGIGASGGIVPGASGGGAGGKGGAGGAGGAGTGVGATAGSSGSAGGAGSAGGPSGGDGGNGGRAGSGGNGGFPGQGGFPGYFGDSGGYGGGGGGGVGGAPGQAGATGHVGTNVFFETGGTGGAGGNGGFGGGGGGGGDGNFGGAGAAGNGGFGGGGGGNFEGPGGNGGFGGGGGAGEGRDAQGGFGGGNPGVTGGGGGLGAGGDIFVQAGASLEVVGGALSGGSVTKGSGSSGGYYSYSTGRGSDGGADGTGIFLQGNQAVTLAAAANTTQTISDVITDQNANGAGGAGRVTIGDATHTGTVVLDATNTYTGGTTITSGTLELATNVSAGSGAITFASASAALKLDATPTNGTTFTNPLAGIAIGDTIDLAGLTFKTGATATVSGSTLTVTSNGVSESFTLSASASIFSATKDSTGGTLLTATAPSIVSGASNSASGSDIDAGKAVTFAVTFDRAVTVTTGANGAPSLTLTGGRTATYTTGSGGTALTFSYTVQTGDNVSDLKATAFNTLPSGTTITDAGGNTADLSGFAPIDSGVQLDTTAPTAPSLALTADTSGAQKITSDPAITYTASAIGDTLLYKVDQGSYSSTIPTFKTDHSQDGNHTVSVEEEDAAGNISTASSLTFTLDTTAPVAPSLALTTDTSGGQKITSNPAITYTASASGDTLLYKVDQGGYSTTIPTFATDHSQDGNHTVSVEEEDAAGNISTASSLTFTLDTTAPAAPALALTTDTSGGQKITSDPAITYTASAIGDTLLYQFDQDGYSTTIPAFATDHSQDGNHTVSVEEEDAAGNISAESNLTFTLDTIAPAAPALALTTDTSGGQKITSDPAITYTASAIGDTLLYKVDQGGYSTTIPAFATDHSQDGNHTVSVEEKDAAGNISAESNLTFTLDTTAPTAPSLALTTDTSGGQKITSDPAITYTASASGDTLLYKVDQGSYSSTLPTFKTDHTQDGSHTVSVEEEDAAGNISVASSLTFTLDTIAPAAPSLALRTDTSGGQKITSDPAITYTASASGDTLLYKVDQGGYSSTIPTFATDGTYTVSVEEEDDAAGNISTASSLTFTLDTTAPTLTGLSETPASGTVGIGGTVVLTLTPSETVSVAGTPTLTLNNGGTAVYDSRASTATALVFDYVVSAGDASVATVTPTTFNLPNGATVEDIAGNAANLSLTRLNQAGGIGNQPGNGPQIDASAPTLIAVSESPATGLLQAGDTDVLTLSTDKAVTVSGVPMLALNDGGTATYDAGKSTATSLAFDYIVSQSDQNVAALAATSIDLANGATMVDAAGNAANLSLASLSQTSPQVAPDLSLFGSITHDVTSAGGDIYALYEAILGRAPDSIGLETFVAERDRGTSLKAIARDLLSSPGDAAKYGHTSNSAFIDQIFENALHRPPSSSDLQVWDRSLTQGASRSQVAVEIARSSESRAYLASTFQTGVFVPNASDATIARLYYGLLDRTPDAGGLAGDEAFVQQGGSLRSIASSIVHSSEYVGLHGSASNAQFVEALFEGAFGRTEGTGGAEGYLHELNTGASRAHVALAIVTSAEAVAHLNPNIESGFHIA